MRVSQSVANERKRRAGRRWIRELYFRDPLRARILAACSVGMKPWLPNGEASQAQAERTVEFQAREDSAGEKVRQATAVCRLGRWTFALGENEEIQWERIWLMRGREEAGRAASVSPRTIPVGKGEVHFLLWERR
jgi:hypothetical protein